MSALRGIASEVPDDQAGDLTSVADQIEDETNRNEPDQTWVLRLVERGRRILTGVQGIGAVAGVIEQADQVINQLGA